MVYLKVTFTVPLFVYNVNMYFTFANIYIVHLHHFVLLSVLLYLLLYFSLIYDVTFDKSCTMIYIKCNSII